MEEAALRLGVARHGQGKWKTIQEASLVLRRRSSVDCKDKWRNLCKLTGADRGKRRAAAGAGKPATQCVQTSLGRFYGQLAKSVNAGHIVARTPRERKQCECKNTVSYGEAGCSVDGTGGELGQTTKCEESEEGKCADVPAMVTPVTTAVAKVHSTPARGEEEGDEEDVSTSAQTAPVTPRTVPRQGHGPRRYWRSLGTSTRRIQMDTRNMFSASLRKHLMFLQEQQNQQDLGQEHLQLTAPLWDYNHPVVGGGVGGSYAQGTHAMTRLGQAPMKGGDIVARPPTERSQCEHPSTDAEDVRAGGGHHTIDQAEGCRPAGHGQTENANPRTPAEISLLPELMTKDGATECKKTVAASHGEESMVGEAPDGGEASRMFRVHADRESWKEAQQEIWRFQHGEKEADKQQLLPHPTSLHPSCSPFPSPLLPPLHPLLDPRSSLLAPRSSLRAPSSSLARRAREIGGGRSIPQTLEQEHKKLERRHNPGKADGGEASRMFRVHADRENWKEAQQEIWRFQHGEKEADNQQLLQRQEEERTKQLRKRALERKLKAEHERKERARGQRLQGQKDEKQQNKMASYRHLAEELGESERNQRLQDSHRRLMERVRQEVKGREEEILRRRQAKRDQRAAAEKRAIRWKQRLVAHMPVTDVPIYIC